MMIRYLHRTLFCLAPMLLASALRAQSPDYSAYARDPGQAIDEG